MVGVGIDHQHVSVQIRNEDRATVSDLHGCDDGRSLSNYDFGCDLTSTGFSDEDGLRKLAYRYRKITEFYKLGLERSNVSKYVPFWQDLWKKTDSCCKNWLSSVQNLLEATLASDQDVVHVIVTAGKTSSAAIGPRRQDLRHGRLCTRKGAAQYFMLPSYVNPSCSMSLTHCTHACPHLNRCSQLNPASFGTQSDVWNCTVYRPGPFESLNMVMYPVCVVSRLLGPLPDKANALPNGQVLRRSKCFFITSLSGR